MIDKKIIKLVGNKKKEVVKITLLNILSLLLNVAFSATVCFTLYSIINNKSLYSIILLITIIIIRFI